jgi:acetyltransferase-like isoleucine patch superfamily enzyme
MPPLRDVLKRAAFWAATLLVLPEVLSYWLRAPLLGRDRAFANSTQTLALVPGLLGILLRRAFLARVLQECYQDVTVEAGTYFSQVEARIGEHVYIGPHCVLGLVHLERDVLVASGVQIPSGPDTHGIERVDVPIREQQGRPVAIRVGEGSWIGSGAILLADVGAGTVVAAGSVVVKPIPDLVVAGGVPARVLRDRQGQPAAGA